MYTIYTNGNVTAIDRSAAETTFGTVYFLPTYDEWYKAAYYDPDKNGNGVGGYWNYPTQDDLPADLDGFDFDGDTEFDAVYREDGGYYQTFPNDITDVGVASAYGTYGQGGNQAEWCETLVISNGRRVVRGGGYVDDARYLHVSQTYVDRYPAEELAILGFRVASNNMVPEPGGIAVWVGLSLLGLAFCKRRKGMDE